MSESIACPHGELRRKCEACAAEDVIDSLRSELAALKSENAQLLELGRKSRDDCIEAVEFVVHAETELATAVARADAAEAALLGCREALRGLFGMVDDGSLVKSELFAGWRLGLLQKISTALADQPTEEPTK